MPRLTWSKVRALATLTILAAGVTSTASAQRVTSEQRIPIRKESAGEVARRDSIARDSIARADSMACVEAARRDSVARAEAARADSIARIEAARRDSMALIEGMRRDSLAREDSIRAAAAAAAVPAALARRGFYIGLAGGASSPTGDYK